MGERIMQSQQQELERLKIIENYIDLVPPALLKQYAIVSLILPDILLTLFVFSDPYIPIISYILLPLFIFITLWVMWIVINPVKRQKQYKLFIGVYAVICSLSMLVLSEKFVYYTMGIHTPYYAIFSIGGYTLVLFFLVRIHFKALYSGFYMASNQKKSKLNKQLGGIGAFTSLGTVLGHILVAKSASYNQTIAVLSGILYFLSLIFIMMMHNLHKYWLIHKYPHLVKYYDIPQKKGMKVNDPK
jgi:hypothetical protein